MKGKQMKREMEKREIIAGQGKVEDEGEGRERM